MKASVADRIVDRLRGFAEALENGEPISERFTCHRVELKLVPRPYSPKLVKQTRKRLRASQTVFALLLGVSPKTVRAWEQGVNPPRDMACRFMDEIGRNPEYWIGRLEESITTRH